MRIVSPAEAVAGIECGDAGLCPLRRSDAIRPARRAGRARGRRGSARRRRGPPPHRGPGAAPCARDGRPLPPPGAVHRAERPRRRERGSRGLRPGVPVGRPASVQSRRLPARRGARQRDAAGRPRLLLARHVASRRMHAAIRAAKTVIAQINRAMPRTLGDSFVHVDEIDLAVEVDVPPYERTASARSATSNGGSASTSPSWFPTAPRSSWASAPSPRRPRCALRDRRDLGIHTEMFTDGVVDLVEAGVVTGARKESNRGKIVTAFVMGTQRLYEFVDDNPMVEMRPVDYTNDTPVIRRVRPDGRDQLGDRGRPDRPGRRRLDRAADVQRRRRADGLHPRRGARRRGPGDHRAAVDGRGRDASRGSCRRFSRAPAW